MELIKAAELRQSIRSYKEDAVICENDIKEILKFAQLAPSWKNSQTGRYYVAASEEMVEKVRKECLPAFNANSTKGAGAYIVTTFVKNCAGFDKDGNPDNELGNEWGAYDLGLQNAYLLLKAAELGYDTLIMGLRDTGKLREYFNIAEEEEVAAVISLGVRDKTTERPVRKALDDVVKFF